MSHEKFRDEGVDAREVSIIRDDSIIVDMRKLVTAVSRLETALTAKK